MIVHHGGDIFCPHPPSPSQSIFAPLVGNQGLGAITLSQVCLAFTSDIIAVWFGLVSWKYDFMFLSYQKTLIPLPPLCNWFVHHLLGIKAWVQSPCLKFVWPSPQTSLTSGLVWFHENMIICFCHIKKHSSPCPLFAINLCTSCRGSRLGCNHPVSRLSGV